MSTSLKFPTSRNAVQKTLDATLLTGVTAAVTLNSVTGIQNKAGVFVVDRVDANGTATPSKREYITFTGVSGSTLTGLVRNADGGGSDQDHAVGAIVEFVSDVLQEQAILDGLLLVVTTAGVLNKASASDVATGTDDAKIVTSLAVAPYANNSLYRQAIINGNFDVWQRGTTITNPAPGYTADRWEAYKGAFAANITVTQQSVVASELAGSKYCVRMQRTASDATSDALFLHYALESQDSLKLIGQKLTLSFYARKGANFSATSNYLVSEIVTGTGTDQKVGSFTGYASDSQNNTLTASWQKFTMTTSSVIATSKTQVGLRLKFTGTGTAGAADYAEITQVQLCAGDVALPFMPKSYEDELRACQRYYAKSFLYSTAPAQNVGLDTNNEDWFNPTTLALIKIRWPVEMRAEPTVTTYNPAAANANIRDITAPADITVSTVSTDHKGITIYGTAAAADRRCGIHWAASAEL